MFSASIERREIISAIFVRREGIGDGESLFVRVRISFRSISSRIDFGENFSSRSLFFFSFSGLSIEEGPRMSFITSLQVVQMR